MSQTEKEIISSDGQKYKQKVDILLEKYYLKFDIIERDINGVEHFFYIKNRSKGFFWFFNFVMKLEFNPDKAGDLDNAIYLLDEPGSYLHPYAQTKLCKKIKEISEQNTVIFSTHSHYLLNPEIIPLNKIHIVNKNEEGGVELQNFYHYKNKKNTNIETAFQTINDALHIKPFDIDINNKNILIVEGIYDYYSFSLFKPNEYIGILPGRGADTLINFISLMIAFEVNFKVIWDNDEVGLRNYSNAKSFFGNEIAERHFNLLPSVNNKKRILQDLFNSSDLHLIKTELNLDNDVSFERKISSLYFSDKRQEILNKISEITIGNFREVFNLFNF